MRVPLVLAAGIAGVIACDHAKRDPSQHEALPAEAHEPDPPTPPPAPPAEPTGSEKAPVVAEGARALPATEKATAPIVSWRSGLCSVPRVDGTPDSVVVVLAPTDDDHPQELGWIDTNTGAVLHRIEAGRAQATMKCIEPGGVALLRPTEGDRWHSIEVYDSVRRERVFRRQGMGTPKDIEPGEGCFSIRVGSKTENWRLPDGEPVVRCANAPEVWEFNTRFALPFSRNHVARTAKLLVEVDGDLRRLELRARRGNSPAWKADLELRSPGWAETSRGHVVTAAPDIVVTYGFELATETDPRAVLIGVDPARGEVVWRASVGNAGKHAQRLLDTGGPIVLAFEGGLLAVDRTDGAEIWRLPPG